MGKRLIRGLSRNIHENPRDDARSAKERLYGRACIARHRGITRTPRSAPVIRFNHVEVTVPKGFVAEHGEALLTFVTETFGFLPSVFPGLDVESLLFKSDPDASQFLFVAEHDAPMPRVSDDHLGLHLDSDDEVAAALARCKAWQARDPRVEIREFDTLDLAETTTRSFYVRYLLPIWFDVQHIAHKAGHEPAREWRFEPAGTAGA